MVNRGCDRLLELLIILLLCRDHNSSLILTILSRCWRLYGRERHLILDQGRGRQNYLLILDFILIVTIAHSLSALMVAMW